MYESIPEETLLELLGHPLACVFDLNPHESLVELLELHANASVLRVLDRVADDLEEELHNPPAIGMDDRRTSQRRDELQLLLLDLVQVEIADFLEDVLHAERLRVYRELALVRLEHR